MLKGIDPILNADLLLALCAMGHGDDLVLADANLGGCDGGGQRMTRST
jgi:L-fucose mutarotase